MRSAYRGYVGARVVVQVGDESIAGTLVEAGDLLVLQDAALLTAGVQDVDGRAVIPSGSVRWLQVLP